MRPFRHRPRPPFTLAVVLALVGWMTPAWPVTYQVDADDPLADFQSIQPAIIAGSDQDTVFVHCGLYIENLVIAGDADGVPDLIGESPECVIVDGGGTGRVVTFVGVPNTVDFTGFTVRNGRATLGGGILVDNADPVISRNFIQSNVAVRQSGTFGYGGGVSLLYASPTLSNNVFEGNVAEFSGGGLDMYQSSPTVVNNTFIGNRAEQPGPGLAYGGAVYALGSTPTLTSNLIYGNQAEAGAGGIDLQNSPYTVSYNDLYQNLPAEWSCVDLAIPCPQVFPFAPGNLSVDPRLDGGTRSCSLGDSPLRDGGPSTAPSATADFFGRPRLLDGNYDGIDVVDIGHCESDEITGLLLGPGGSVSWTASPSPAALYHLYRGALGALRTSCLATPSDCQYTQDLLAVPEARQECGLATAGFTDPDVPSPGEGFVYLTTGKGIAEGSLGMRSDGTARDNDHPCP